ncbi:MAG: trigger factor [Gemmatimonadetes bacterium]|nr:trigger factor [Gemmatimonadota bacterium]
MTIDVSKLSVSLEEGERWRRTLSITVPRELVESERRSAVKAFSARLRLPGFRTGKVPPAVVEKRFGQTLEKELLDRVIGDVYRRVLEQRELRPITEGKVGQVDYRPESDLSFAISFDVAPKIELARLGGFKIDRPAIRVTDEAVETMLTRVREREGTWVPLEVGKPGTGDMVQVRIQRLDEEGPEPRSYEFRLGSGEAIGGVERAIESLEVGGSGEFTIEFPGEAVREAAPGEPASGSSPPSTRKLRVFLDGRKRLELPELDDEFARATGEFKSVEDMRNRIREDLETEAGREADVRVKEALLEEILSANSFEVPESMLDRFIQAALGNPKELDQATWAEAKQELRPGAVRAVKRHLVMGRVAEAEGLSATQDEVDARIEEIASKNGVSPSEVYSRLQRAGHVERLERELTEEKVFEFLKKKSEILEGL